MKQKDYSFGLLPCLTSARTSSVLNDRGLFIRRFHGRSLNDRGHFGILYFASWSCKGKSLICFYAFSVWRKAESQAKAEQLLRAVTTPYGVAASPR